MKRYTVKETANFLGVDEQVIYRLKNKGDLKSLNGLRTDVEFSEYELKRYQFLETLIKDNVTPRLVDNQHQNVLSVLSNHFKNRNTRKVIIDVAFLKNSGWNLIRRDLLNILENDGEVEVIVGLDFAISDPEPIKEMIRWKSVGKKIDIYCYKNGNQNFHPKFYYFENDHGVRTTLCGSSNLTRGGFVENVELNLLSHDPNDSDLIDQQLILFHGGLLRSDNLFIPTIENINEYEHVAKRAKKLTAIRDRVLHKVEPSLKMTIEQIKSIYNKTAGGTSQEGLIVTALSSITPNSDGWVHLDQIYDYVRIINNREQLGWNDKSLESSIRGRLNNNYVALANENDFKGKAIFVRKKRGEGFYKLAIK